MNPELEKLNKEIVIELEVMAISKAKEDLKHLRSINNKKSWIAKTVDSFFNSLVK
jgi:hypothetical protein